MLVGCQPEPETPIAPPPARPILEFGKLADDNEDAKWVNEQGRWKPATAIINSEENALTSDYFKKESVTVLKDNMGNIWLSFQWNEEGSKLSKEITGTIPLEGHSAIAQPLYALRRHNIPYLPFSLQLGKQ